MQFFTEQGSSASRKSNGCYCKIARLWRTSRWCSLCLHASKIGGRSQIAQNSKVRMSRTYGYVLHDANGPNHGQTLKILWYLSNEIYVDTHWQDCCGKDSSRKFYWNLDGEKSTTLGMSACSSKTRIILIGKRGRHVNANRMKLLLRIIPRCSNHVFSAGAPEKLPG